jgi:hypothetical protein
MGYNNSSIGVRAVVVAQNNLKEREKQININLSIICSNNQITIAE